MSDTESGPLKRSALAVQQVLRAAGLALEVGDEDADWVWRCRAALAEALRRQGESESAEAMLRQARAKAIATLGEGHPALADDPGS